MNSNRKKRILHVLAAVLALAVLVVVVGVILVGQCLSFDENGAHVIDRYGVLAMEGQENQDTSSSPEAEPESVQQPEEQHAEENENMQSNTIRAAIVPTWSVTDEYERGRMIGLAQRGILDTVIVDIKDRDGKVNVNLHNESLLQDEEDTSAFEQAVGKLHDAGIHVIGRVYCLHDEAAVEMDSDLAMQFDEGGIWTDYDRTHWLDPTNPETVQYLSSIAQAAAQIGCDEIALADLIFPPRGHLDRIEFYSSPESQAGVLGTVLEEIQNACGEIPISLTADSLSDLTELSQLGAEDGIQLGDAAWLLSKANRLLVSVNDTNEAAFVIAAAAEIVPERETVPIFYDADVWTNYEGNAAVNVVESGIDGIAAIYDDTE